jgi:hypothetical protein
MSSEQGTKCDQSPFSSGKKLTKPDSVVSRRTLSFIDNFFTVLPQEDNSELKDAMESTEPIIAAAFPLTIQPLRLDKTTTPQWLDAPSNEAVAVENPLDHGNASKRSSGSSIQALFSERRGSDQPKPQLTVYRKSMKRSRLRNLHRTETEDTN